MRKFPDNLHYLPIVFLFFPGIFSPELSSGAEWPPPGKRLICPVTRDAGISSVDGEQDGNTGRASRLKLKSIQEMILFDIDPEPLKGKIITGALLHIRSASPDKAPLERVGVSTVATPWEEGRSERYADRPGGVCYNQAVYPKRYWAWPDSRACEGSQLVDAVFGSGHAIWRFADCTPPDADGWQTCAVDPDVVAARAAGLGFGFCACDETGSTWSIRKGVFRYNLFPNRMVYSRESLRSGPWLEVWVNGSDTIPPEPVHSLEVFTSGCPPGEALVTWNTPEDRGGGHTLGFTVRYVRDGKTADIPRYLVPAAGKPGEPVHMYIQDTGFGAGEKILLKIVPVDSAGNTGPEFARNIRLSDAPDLAYLPLPDIAPFPPSDNLPCAGPLKVSVVDLLDKINPVTGQFIPAHPSGYRGGNHLFSAVQKRIRLQAARNEAVCFQVVLEGQCENVSIRYNFDNSALKPAIYESAYVRLPESSEILPDPLIALSPGNSGISVPSGAGRVRVPEQKLHSLTCEVQIPHDLPPGIQHGKLIIEAEGKRLELAVDLKIRNFTLPDKLSFVPEMNAYNAVSPYKGYDYYRLAHEHRTCINRLPYGWSGKPAFAPEWDGADFDWKKWDQKAGPLLDGSAFAGLPRSGEPVDVFYLPFNENWPVNLFDSYRPSYWADEAFAPAYAASLKNAFAAFARHVAEKGWNTPVFQFYLNNKAYYRKNFPRSSAPWIFDEPANIQDFMALRWYGLLWHEAVEPVAEKTRMWYRADVSYSRFSRDMLDGVADIVYIGANSSRKTRMIQDARQRGSNIYLAEYGTPNPVNQPNTQPVFWSLSAWGRGATGILPWQAIGGPPSWETANDTALFYPAKDGPVPSVRLKAFRRGQQDVEYLAWLAEISGTGPAAVARWLNREIDLGVRVEKKSASDAGTAYFRSADPAALWKVRYMAGQAVSSFGPAFRRELVRHDISDRSGSVTAVEKYVSPAPDVQASGPVCDSFAPAEME